MNQERAREIVDKALDEWTKLKQTPMPDQWHYIADALHAAYEKERANEQPNYLKVTADGCIAPMRDPVDPASARLSSVKETARAIWAAYFVSGDTPMAQWYSGGKDVERIKADTNAVVNLADELESAFERRYGGKP